MRPPFTWNLGARCLELGPRTLVMGILNVTPDSFSDGGLYFEPGAAIAHGLRLLDEGADILDIGGESTRPGAHSAVAAEDELRRILPVISGIKSSKPETVVSVDTHKASVARAAVKAGAEIVNDISGLTWDDAMARTIADLGCGAVLMYTRGRPQEWRSLPPLDDVVGSVKSGLKDIASHATHAGIAKEKIVLDPGFGFGKNYEQNHPMLARFAELQELGFPLLTGVSRKSFIKKLAGAPHFAPLDRSNHADPQARCVGTAPQPPQLLAGSVAAAVICALNGAHIVRVHDVVETVQAMAVVDAALAASHQAIRRG